MALQNQGSAPDPNQGQVRRKIEELSKTAEDIHTEISNLEIRTEDYRVQYPVDPTKASPEPPPITPIDGVLDDLSKTLAHAVVRLRELVVSLRL